MLANREESIYAYRRGFQKSLFRGKEKKVEKPPKRPDVLLTAGANVRLGVLKISNSDDLSPPSDNNRHPFSKRAKRQTTNTRQNTRNAVWHAYC